MSKIRYFLIVRIDPLLSLRYYFFQMGIIFGSSRLLFNAYKMAAHSVLMLVHSSTKIGSGFLLSFPSIVMPVSFRYGTALMVHVEEGMSKLNHTLLLSNFISRFLLVGFRSI